MNTYISTQDEEDEDEDVEDDDETRMKRDVPTEDDIQRLTSDVDIARGEQKNLFLILFQVFYYLYCILNLSKKYKPRIYYFNN